MAEQLRLTELHGSTWFNFNVLLITGSSYAIRGIVNKVDNAGMMDEWF
jgi:hypothetical protein